MPDIEPDPPSLSEQRHRALSGWDNEGGAGPLGLQEGPPVDPAFPGTPPLTDAELLHLRVRVIALENLVIALLADGSERQLEVAREMATFISPRPGFTPHPMTVQAAVHMVDLVNRAGHFRSGSPLEHPRASCEVRGAGEELSMSDVEYRVAGVLPSAKALQAVIDRLEVAGLDRAQFGVLASRAALFGHGHYEMADELAADPSTPTAAVQGMESRGALTGTLIGGLSYVGAAAATAGVILTGGGLGLAIAATIAAGGASGLAGALVAHGFGQSHASMIHDQLAGGGIVLWIRPRDDQQEHAVVSELEGAGATKIVVQGRKERSPQPSA